MVLKNSFSKLVMVIFSLFISGGFSWGQATTVAVEPASKTVEEISSSFTLDIVVNNVNNLHGASVTVTWDNTILHYDGVSQGNFLKGGGSVFFAANPSPPTEPNSVTVDQAILGPYAVSGSGLLFSINFTSLQFGTSPITITSIDLRDINNAVIDAAVVSGQVQVGTIRQIIISTNPSGLDFTVDETTYSSSQTFSWGQGTSHTISVNSPQSGGEGVRYIYTSWSDAGEQSHTYTAPAYDETVTANFKTQYQLTVQSLYGSPSGEGWYDQGSDATFAVTPTTVSGGEGTQYLFTGWTGSGSGSYTGSNVSHTVMMNNPITETANWSTQYYLTAAEAPNEGGDMTPAPPGGWHDSGSGVTVEATPNTASGYIFSDWSGDLTGTTNPTSITMDSPKSVTANFTLLGQYRVTTNPEGLHINVDGSEYTSPQDFSWPSGSSHTIAVASPQSGGSGIRYVYQSWSDGGAQTHQITVDGTSVYTANFTTQYYLTTGEAPDAGGDMTPAPPGGWYNSGSGVTVEATPNTASGYVFSGWSGDVTGSTNPTFITMDGPKSVTANFTLLGQYRVTTNPEGLLINVDGTEYTSPQDFSWPSGSSHTIAVASPQSGGSGIRYVYQSWSDGGAQTHQITVDGTSVYTANFTTQYYLTTGEAPDAGGDMTPAPPGGWYNSGSTVTVEATPNTASGYVFSGWSGDLTGSTNPSFITMDGPKSVTANFTLLGQYRVTTNPEGLLINVDGTEYTSPHDFSWPSGSSHTIGVASPQDFGTGIRYVYQSWSDGGAQAHQITVDGTSVYAASFSTQYYLTTGKVPDDGGDMTPAPPGEWHNSGSTVTVEATPNTALECIFLGWSGDLTGSTNPSSVTMDSPKSVTANFSNPVPVELCFFTAEIVPAETGRGEMVELRWQTVSEVNNYGFEIERAINVKPKRWQRLGFVHGHGTSSSLHQYSFVDNTVTPFGTYFYRLKQINTDGTFEYSPEISVSFQKLLTYQLQQNYPNPFNPVTMIAFDLPQQSDVRLVLVNVRGDVIKVITEGSYQAGRHEVVLNAADLASGIYFYRIEAGGFMDVKKLVVMK